MEQWQLVGLITRRSLVRIQLPLPVRGRRQVRRPLLLPPSSSGPGRHPFKVEIRGSNPLGGTNEEPSGPSRSGRLPASPPRPTGSSCPPLRAGSAARLRWPAVLRTVFGTPAPPP